MFESAGVRDDPDPFVMIVPVISGVFAVLLIACVTTAIGGLVYSKSKKTTTWNATKEQSTSVLSPHPTKNLVLQTVTER